MSDEHYQLVKDGTGAGMTASHPESLELLAPTAPTSADEFNTIREPLIPVACWRLDDIRFEFDSSFILPESAAEFRLLAVLVRDHPDAPLSVFGHADPVGDDDYNKQLSGRRAMAVYAVLTRRKDLWERLYSKPQGNDRWGARSLQIMLDSLGFTPGRTDGVMDDPVRDSLKQFQQQHGLSPSGRDDSATREKLFESYMDRICRHLGDEPFRLQGTAFLGQGSDVDGKADYQGCSEFNPVLMFSREENNTYSRNTDKTARNEDNAPNRRVVIYLFRPGSRITPNQWPCPKAREGISGCQQRFWSDHRRRRSFQENRRTNQVDGDTYACRFYDRIASRSPCEGTTRVTVIKIIFQTYPGTAGPDADRGIANVPYKLTVVGEYQREGQTAQDGSLTVALPVGGTALVDILGTTYHLQVRDSLEAVNTLQGVQRRLVMLGYDISSVDGTMLTDTDDSILRFQADQSLDTDGDSGLTATGNVSSSLQNVLKSQVGE